MDLAEEFKKGQQAIADALVDWQIAAVNWDESVEGGLVLTLKEVNREDAYAEVRYQRVTLGFTELGMWLEKVEELPKDY